MVSEVNGRKENMSKIERVPFEDALKLTGFGKFNLLTLLLCGSIITSMAFELFSVAYLVPASACELNTTSAEQGLMAAMPLIGIIATSHFWGYLADTRGRKKVLAISMTISFVVSATAALSPNWITFAVLKVVSAGSVSGGFALACTLLSECNPEEKRSTLLLLTGSIFFCCSGVMAVIAIPVLPLSFSYSVALLNIEFNSWRLLNLIYSLPCAISAVSLYFALESPKFLLSVGKEDEALEVLRTMFVINNNKSGEEYPVRYLELDEGDAPEAVKGACASIIAQTAPLFKPPLLKDTILLSTIFVVSYICLHGYVVWMPYIVDGYMRSVQRGEVGMTLCQRLKASQNFTIDLVENKCALNESAITMVLSIYLILAVINTGVSVLVNYFNKKALLIIVQVLCGIAGLTVNMTTQWQLTAALFVVFISGIINFNFLVTFSVDIFPTYVKAMAVCLTLMVGRGSAVVGVNVLKEMLNSSCDMSFYIFPAIILFGGALQLLLPAPKEIKKKDLKENMNNDCTVSV